MPCSLVRRRKPSALMPAVASGAGREESLAEEFYKMGRRSVRLPFFIYIALPLVFATVRWLGCQRGQTQAFSNGCSHGLSHPDAPALEEIVAFVAVNGNSPTVGPANIWPQIKFPASGRRTLGMGASAVSGRCWRGRLYCR